MKYFVRKKFKTLHDKQGQACCYLFYHSEVIELKVLFGFTANGLLIASFGNVDR